MGRVAIGTLLRETYLIERMLGTGGMGEVYEATHRRLSGRYAIKVLLRELASQPDAIARFRREAELTSSLRHPNIVQVIDFNLMDDGAPYLVMECLDGVDLGTRLVEQGPMSLTVALPLVKQIASGLAAAHARGIVHRDLKPQNIFLVRIEGEEHEEIAKVLDFGISKMKSAAKSVTQDFAVIGTPQYMSPEQALGKIDEIDHATDQFALGAITYEMLTGRPAFTGDDPLAVMYQVVNVVPEPLVSGTDGRGPSAVEAVLLKAMAKKKKERYGSVTEFSRALAAAAVAEGAALPGLREATLTPAPAVAFSSPLLAAERPVRTPTTFRTAVGELSARARRPRLTVAVAAGALALVGLVGLLSFKGRSVPKAPAVRAAAPAPPRPPATLIERLAPVSAPEEAILGPVPEPVVVPEAPRRRGSRGSRGQSAQATSRRDRASEHERQPAPVVNEAPAPQPPPAPPKPASDLVKGDDL
jgi:tRNA A-37 threonylcarbamoyl transferase component Bud32